MLKNIFKSKAELPEKACELVDYLGERCGSNIGGPTMITKIKQARRFISFSEDMLFKVAISINKEATELIINNDEPVIVGDFSDDTCKNSDLIISGQDSRPSMGYSQSGVTVQAIITLYNDKDIIKQVLQHLTKEGVAVHIIDNWSSDGSFEKVVEFAKQHKTVTYEKYPKSKPKYYEWTSLLKRVEEVSSGGKHDWYIHYDADEIRISPWQDVKLREAINFVDSRGYSALDFTVIDFRPTKDGFDGTQPLETCINYFEFGRRPGHFLQIKAWKNTGHKVDISSSGGHEAIFPGRKVYPLKFITKHYPLRSSAQAKKKIFSERLPRISPEEKKKGWHIQYNKFGKDDKFIWPQEGLIKFNDKARRKYLIELLTGIGIARE